jgi:hypothetical protein
MKTQNYVERRGSCLYFVTVFVSSGATVEFIVQHRTLSLPFLRVFELTCLRYGAAYDARKRFSDNRRN